MQQPLYREIKTWELGFFTLVAYFCTLSLTQQQHLLGNICKIFFFSGDQCELWGAHTSPYGCTGHGHSPSAQLGRNCPQPSHCHWSSRPDPQERCKSISEKLLHLLQSLGAELTVLLGSRIRDASILEEFTAYYCFSISNCISCLSVCRDLLLLLLPASSYAPQGPAALLSQSIIDHGH